MKFKYNVCALLAAVVALSVGLAGCSDAPAPNTRTVTLKLTAAAPNVENPNGTLHVYTYNTWRGNGELRHPLAPIEEYLEFDYTGDVIEHEFEYTDGWGIGFAVYAWLDTDGDGILCTPTKRDEFAGFGKSTSDDPNVAIVSLEMNGACAGPDRFFPVPE